MATMTLPIGPMLLAVGTGTLSTICYCVYLCLQDRTDRPPGPTPIPFFGNVLQIKEEHQYKTFKRWGNHFGDVVFGRIFRTPILVLNSLQAAEDLLEKKSSIYSDRPNMILHVEMFGCDSLTTHLHYGERLRKQRKWIQRAFGDKSALVRLRPLMRREMHVLLLGLLKMPSSFKLHFERMLASIIVETVYGHTINSLDDRYVRLAEEATGAITDAAGPAAMLVDYFPLLKYIPMWMPGAGWKRDAVGVRVFVERMQNIPLQLVEAEMTAGTARPSLTESLLQEFAGNIQSSAENYEDIKGVSSILYAAGTETSVTTFKKAQDEIDRVVGPERLPDFGDREVLPYLECLMKEVLRWQPTVPIDLPHRLMVDDQYRGYNIPSGTTILPNIWAMTRDTDMYPDPEAFRPERFANLDGNTAERSDPRGMVFGFGRRICPGRNFVDSLLWLVMANIIAVFDIRRACDAEGNEIIPEIAFVPGLVSRPKPFVCDIRPRSEHVARVIADVCASTST